MTTQIKNLTSEVDLISVITCPKCGRVESETMPADACQWFYGCKGCGEMLKPRPGDCCVYCSWGTLPCPPMQKARASADPDAGGNDCKTQTMAAHEEMAFDELQYKRTKEALIDLTRKFSVDEYEGIIVDETSVNSAVAFLLALPNSCMLPQIAPDEDGVLMVWERPQRATIITFVGHELHAVDNAGSPTSNHITPIGFDGVHIPDEIARCIPSRV